MIQYSVFLGLQKDEVEHFTKDSAHQLEIFIWSGLPKDDTLTSVQDVNSYRLWIIIIVYDNNIVYERFIVVRQNEDISLQFIALLKLVSENLIIGNFLKYSYRNDRDSFPIKCRD